MQNLLLGSNVNECKMNCLHLEASSTKLSIQKSCCTFAQSREQYLYRVCKKICNYFSLLNYRIISKVYFICSHKYKKYSSSSNTNNSLSNVV